MKKVIAILRERKKTLLICLIPALLLIWYFHPVTLLSDAEADKIASIYIHNGYNEEEVYLSDLDAMAYIIDCFQDKKFYHKDPAFGTGTRFSWKFYDKDGKTLCDIRMRDTDSLKKNGWFYAPAGDAVNYEALEAYSAKLTSWGAHDGDMPLPPQEEDFATPDIPVGAALAKYSFDTDHITFWIDMTGWNGALGGYLKYEITDAHQLRSITADIDLQNNLQPIPVAEQFADYAPNSFLDFHNGTVLAYLGGSAGYLWIIEQADFGSSKEDFAVDETAIGPYRLYQALGPMIEYIGSNISSLYDKGNPSVTLVKWDK